jgi:uncharacterized membrane protein
MDSINIFTALKILHIGSLVFWLGPSLGAWYMLMALRKYEGEFTKATHLGYKIFIQMLIVEHIAFVCLLISGIGMAVLIFGFGQGWLQWKLLIILLLIIPLEIADIWYGNIKLPQIFSTLNAQGYDKGSSTKLHIYHTYITRTAIAVMPVSVLAIMWLVIAKPNIISLWQ